MRIIFILSLILFSCSDDATNTTSSTNTSAIKSNKKLDVPNKVCSADVEGMVCKMGCVASIKKELNALNGVSTVDIDFKEDQTIQLVKVSFNDKNVDEVMIQGAIEKINNNQFQVSALRIENLID
jgi:copper chaperone CopZ